MKYLMLSVLCFFVVHGYTQLSAKQIQPKIMVVPRVSDGEDMKKMYDTSETMQIAIAKLNEAFQKRGANLRSFDQVLKQVTQNSMMNKVSGNEQDYKTMVLAQSGADIYVETKLIKVHHASRNANSVTVIMEAYQTGTSNSLASKTVSSPMFQTSDIGQLAMQAIDTASESFLALMQQRFNEIVENGQSIYVEFTIAPNAKIDFDTEMPEPKGALLSEVINTWFEKNAYKGVFNNQGVVSNKLIMSDVRIPLRNPNNPNANYSGQNLYADILKYLRSIGLSVKREIGTNNKLLITLNKD